MPPTTKNALQRTSRQEPEIPLPPGGDEVAAASPALPPDGERHARSMLDAVVGGACASSATAAGRALDAGHPHRQQPPRDGPLLLADDEQRHALLPRRLHDRRAPVLPFRQGKLHAHLVEEPTKKKVAN